MLNWCEQSSATAGCPIYSACILGQGERDTSFFQMTTSSAVDPETLLPVAQWQNSLLKQQLVFLQAMLDEFPEFTNDQVGGAGHRACVAHQYQLELTEI
eukprot:2462911-Rhodomonas_salina.2